MKRFLLLVCCVVAFAGGLRAQADYDNLSASPSKKRPALGMTKSEVKARYGEPFNRWKIPGGERWLYRLKFDEVYGRAYVPFMFDSDNVHLGTIDFGAKDRITALDWRQSSLQL